MPAVQAPMPKYLQVLNAIRERIETGTYRPGAALPSEAQLSTEFEVSRPTVLKALAILKQDGWIESHQGKASFVRGRPTAGRRVPPHARLVLDADETVDTELLGVAPILADARTAGLLAIPEGTPVYRRQRRTMVDGAPVDLVTTFLPVEVAVGSQATKPVPIDGSLTAHLAAVKGVRGDYAVELTAARTPTPDEAKLLAIDAGEPVLVVTIAIYTAAGQPLFASVVVLPGNRHEIEDTYPLS
jgi:GntR family transcriptional regulator